MWSAVRALWVLWCEALLRGASRDLPLFRAKVGGLLGISTRYFIVQSALHLAQNLSGFLQVGAVVCGCCPAGGLSCARGAPNGHRSYVCSMFSCMCGWIL